MTDKQINYEQNSVIIDGVDVSECVNFRPDADTSEISYINACSIGLWQRWYSNLEPSCQMSCHCKNNKDCHYKKWQRKEQKCNRLKEEVSLLKESNSKLQQIEDVNSLEKCYLQQIDQLKAENDGLKEKIMYLESEIDRLNG